MLLICPGISGSATKTKTGISIYHSHGGYSCQEAKQEHATLNEFNYSINFDKIMLIKQLCIGIVDINVLTNVQR